MKPKLVIILGPTGVGKSDVAFDAALRVNGEIINADSQQLYRHLDIGTAKPSVEQRERIPHHLIDIVNPDEEFDVAAFRAAAARSAEAIKSSGRNPIVCGGTALYLKALTQGLFVGPGKDHERRKVLEAQAAEKGLAFLYEKLQWVDADAARRIHPNDRQRIVRALEVFAVTGRSISEWQREHGFGDRPFEALKIGLVRERADLYDLINRRCDEMVAQGLVGEVEGLLARGYSLELRPLQSIGYRHMGLYLSGCMTLEEAVSLMKRDSRRLAKRQLTWFRADGEIQWFHPDEAKQKIIPTVTKFLT